MNATAQLVQQLELKFKAETDDVIPETSLQVANYCIESLLLTPYHLSRIQEPNDPSYQSLNDRITTKYMKVISVIK